MVLNGVYFITGLIMGEIRYLSALALLYINKGRIKKYTLIINLKEAILPSLKPYV